MLRVSTAGDKLNVAIFRMPAGHEDVPTIEVFGASCVYGWVVLEGGEGVGVGPRRGPASRLGARSKNTTGRRRHMF